MDRNTAKFEVDGPAAHQIAKHIVSNVGMDTENVSESEIHLTVNGDGETQVSVRGAGPKAGILVSAMVGGIEWDDHTAVGIDATFAEAEQTDDDHGDEGDGTDAKTDSSTNGDPAAYKPQVTPLVDSVNPKYVEFPGNEPGRIRENTQVHTAGMLLVEWYETMDNPWADTDDLAGFAGDDMTRPQVQSAMSRLFKTKGLTVRRQVQGAGTRKYEYTPTKELVDEIKRLDNPDADGAVDGE